jgi:hypothetical protein
LPTVSNQFFPRVLFAFCCQHCRRRGTGGAVPAQGGQGSEKMKEKNISKPVGDEHDEFDDFSNCYYDFEAAVGNFVPFFSRAGALKLAISGTVITISGLEVT